MKAVLISSLLVCLSTTTQAAETDSPNARIVKRDFARLMDWLPGRYDNQEQIYFEDEMAVEPEKRHKRHHYKIAPIMVDGLDGQSFHVSGYRDDDPERALVPYIYNFTIAADNTATALSVFSVTEDRDTIKRSDLTAHPNCGSLWRYNNGHYRAEPASTNCAVTGIVQDFQLTQSALWLGAHDHPAEPIKAHKARPFKCWVSPKKADGSSGFYPTVKVHDQGGRAWVTGEGHETVGLKIRQVIWPYGRNRPSLVLYVYKEDEPDKAVSYAWTDYNGTRLGINLRWMQASCTVSETDFFEEDDT